MANKLRRSRDNRWIAGVCGGIAEYFGLSPKIVRIICADYGVWKRADALHYTGNLYTKRGGALSEIWRPNMRGIE